jgi:hypothetical protein
MSIKSERRRVRSIPLISLRLNKQIQIDALTTIPLNQLPIWYHVSHPTQIITITLLGSIPNPLIGLIL